MSHVDKPGYQDKNWAKSDNSHEFLERLLPKALLFNASFLIQVLQLLIVINWKFNIIFLHGQGFFIIQLTLANPYTWLQIYNQFVTNNPMILILKWLKGTERVQDVKRFLIVPFDIGQSQQEQETSGSIFQIASFGTIS